MKRVAVSLALLLTLCVSALASEDLYANGFFPERSGDVIIKSDVTPISVHATFSSQFGDVVTMRDVDVASRVASVLAIQGAPSNLLAPAPKAHFTFVISGLPMDNAVRIQSTQLPAASSRAASIASLLTGSTASVHGIVADSWYSNGKYLKNAFESSAEYPLVSQVQDVIALTNELNDARQAVVVSASSSPLLVRALAVRPELRLRLGEAASVVEISSGAFGSTPVSSALSSADVRALIVQEFPEHSLVADSSFDSLYAELAFGVNLIAGISAAQRPMSDGALDAVFLGVDGLATVARKYGVDSIEYSNAVALTKVAIARIMSLAQKAYGSVEAVSSVVVSMTGAAASLSIPQDLPVQAVALPHIYVSEINRASVCASLTSVGLEVDCGNSKRSVMQGAPASPAPEAAPVAPPVASPVAVPVAAPMNGTMPPTNATAPTAPPSPVTPDEVAMFQVVLWTAVLLITVVLATVLTFCYMDVGEDSLLYRSTAIPNRPNPPRA